MALEGTLRDFSLADILQLISLQRKTGILRLRSEDDTVTLGFDQGRLISAESAARRMDTRLGTLLVKTRCLTPDLLQRALEIQGQTLQRLGYILLKNGFCTPDDLRAGLDTQIRKIAYTLFRWTDGDYVFDQQDSIDYDHEFVTPITVESLLMNGARMIDEWPIVEKVVRSPALVYRRVPVSQPVVASEDDEESDDPAETTLDRASASQASSQEPIKISRAEWAVYELVDGRRTVGDIVDRTFLSDFDGAKAFYDLVTRHLVEEAPPAAAALHLEGTGSIEVPAARARRAIPLAVGLGLAGAAVLVVGLLFQPRNPMNALTLPQRDVAVGESFGKSLSLLRLRRLAGAIDVYYLVAGRFPDALEAVVAARLIPSADLRDPWGRAYRYVLQGDRGKYYLVGYDGDGKTDTDLFLSHTVRGSDSSGTQVIRSGGRGEVIVIN